MMVRRTLCILLAVIASSEGAWADEREITDDGASEAEDGESTDSGSATGTDPSSGDAATSQPILECPDKPAKKATARKLAGRLFAEGESAYTDKAFRKALEQFLCSMSIIEHENTLTNIEKSAKALEDKRTTLALLDGYLENAPDSELNTEVANLATPLAEAIAAEEQAERETAPPVKEEDVEPECPEISVEAASHVGMENVNRYLLISGWSEIGVGAATFIAAIVLQASAAAAKNNATSTARYDTFLEEKERYRALQVGATSAFITGIVLASVGVTHLYLSRRVTQRIDLSQRGDARRVSVAPGVGWLAVEGTF